MEFRILGNLEAESAGRRVPLGGQRDRRVLAALLLDAGRMVPARRLVEAAWDDPPATAGRQVSNAVSRLRRVLDGPESPSLIVTEAGGYRLVIDRCAVDARVFEARVTTAGQAASEGRTADAAGLLRSALALWRGPALAGVTGRVVESAAAAWNQRRFAAQEMCFEYELALGRHREILGELADWVACYPLREKLVGQYMLALYRCGRQVDALAVYRDTRELLARDLGLDPAPDLRGLQQQVLSADPGLALHGPMPMTARLAEGSRLAEGRARRAAASPGADWEGAAAGADAGTALPAATALPQVRRSLPADTVAFTGRAEELSQITAAVTGAARAGRIVTVRAIEGMPGAGKTALAVRAAHALAKKFPDRQLFIDLHAHTPGYESMRPEDALAGLLAAIGVDPRYLPGDLGGRAGMWRDRMAGQRAVLVLDNATSSGQVAPLLPGTGECLVLVTSRRHLGDLPGAVTPVTVNSLPPGEAADMFTQLAPEAAADHKGVAEVVRLAGFLPLAIWLMARVFARHPSWTLADLTGETQTRLLTMTAEHHSVAAAFEVSYRHLNPASQRLFRLLGAHPGTTIDGCAAAALAGVGLGDAAALLDGLHQEGLLTEVGYRRYGMHDLLHRYARDLAAADSGDGQLLRIRHSMPLCAGTP